MRNAADVLMPTSQDSRPPATSYARRNIACALAIALAALALVVFPAAIPPLVALVRDGTDEQKANAALALQNLAGNDDNKVAIAKAGGIPPLVALVRDGTADQKHYATAALSFLAANADNQVAIAKAGGIPPLVALVRDE